MSDWAAAVWCDLQQDTRGKEWSQLPPWLPLLSVLFLTCDAHTKDPMQPVSWRPQSTSHSAPSPHSSGLGLREAQLASMRREYCGNLFYLSLGGLSRCPGPPPREPCIWLFSSEGFRAPGSGNRGILVAVIQCPVRRKLCEEGFVSAQIPGDSPSLWGRHSRRSLGQLAPSQPQRRAERTDTHMVLS